MQHARPCSALLSLTLTGSLLLSVANPTDAFAGGRGAGTTSTYFGMEHLPLGAASLGTDPAGHLVVSNIGSSGQDGVSVDLGKISGFTMQCDFGQSGSLPPGSRSTLRAHFQTGDTPSQTQVHLQESNGGQCDVLFDYTGVAATCVHVELFLDYQKVGNIRMVHPPGTPPGFALPIGRGDIGGTSNGSPPTCEWKVEEGEKIFSINCPSTDVWLIALPGHPPVMCDQMAVTLEGLPPVPCVLTQCDVLASNPNGGSVTIAGEALKIKHKGWDGLIYGHARAVGQAHISGIAGPDICAGCYECCHPESASALAMSSGVVMSNIGSSGQDGVSILCSELNGPATFPEMELSCSPLDFSQPGAMVQFRTRKGMSDFNTRTCAIQLDNNQATSSLDVSADFSSLGSIEALVEVRSGGATLGSFLVPNAPGALLAALRPGGGGLPLHVTRCANLAGDPLLGQPGFELHFDSAFMLIGNGQVYLGDELRVRAADSTLSTIAVEELICYGRHIRQGILTCRAVPPATNPAPVTLAHSGMLHTAQGQCDMLVRDSDGDGHSDLQISNIGSSGQDGVEIDLGRSQGCAVAFAGNGVSASNQYARLHYEISDDECEICPDGVVASMDIDAASPSSAIFSAQGRGAGFRGHVTILKRGTLLNDVGDDQHFPLVDNEPWSITASPGATISVGELSGKFGYSVALSEDAGIPIHQLEMHITLSQASAGGAGTGVTISHPLHGTITDVDEIVVTQCIDLPPGVGTIDRARLLVTASTICNPCSVALRTTQVAQFMHMHRGLGQTQLVAEDCDDADPQFSPTLWAANIGSSGQDGVAIDLGRSLRARTCPGDAMPEVVGMQFLSKKGYEYYKSSSNMMRGSLVGNPETSNGLASVTRSSPTPGSATISCDHAWTSDVHIRLRARDALGATVLDVANLPPGPMCSQTGDEPGAYTGTFTVTVTSTLTGGPAHLIEACTQELSWPSDVMISVPGQTPVLARSLEMLATPTSGQPQPAVFMLHDVLLLRQTFPGVVTALGIEGEELVQMPPVVPCPADINGDNTVNVADLLSVISSWGACPPAPANCPADTNGDQNVNVADLLAVISAWGACQ